MRLALLADVHGAALPFERALADARRLGFDRLVFMGDLLTYGVDPLRVVELAADAVERDGMIMLRGNHDQLYFDLHGGSSEYFAKLPAWVAESVSWTRDRLGDTDLESVFDWRDEWIADSLLLSHANPFGGSDWTYLTKSDAFERACSVLAARGLRWGVFGHSHRARSHSSKGSTAITIGSLGQPRDDRARFGSWSLLTLEDGELSLEQRAVCHDWSAHKAAINNSGFSETTIERLCGFYP